MDNPAAPEFVIDWKGKSITLHYEYRDFAAAERRLKLALLPGSAKSAEVWGEFSPTEEIEAALFIGLLREVPDLTLEAVREGLSTAGWFELHQVATRALFDFMSRSGLPVEGGSAPAPPPLLITETTGTSSR